MRITLRIRLLARHASTPLQTYLIPTSANTGCGIVDLPMHLLSLWRGGCYSAWYAGPGHFRTGDGARRACGTLTPPIGSIAGSQRSDCAATGSARLVSRFSDAAAFRDRVRFSDLDPARSRAKRDAAAHSGVGASHGRADWEGPFGGRPSFRMGVAEARAFCGGRHARRDAISRVQCGCAGDWSPAVRVGAADDR